jgi:hypothetical protein
VLPLPGVGIVDPNITVPLPARFATGVPDRDAEHVPATVRTDVTAVSEGLFLEIVPNFPVRWFQQAAQGTHIGKVDGM